MHGVFTRIMLSQLIEEADGDRAEAPRYAGVGRATMYHRVHGGPCFREAPRRSKAKAAVYRRWA
jgi:hypothetical protein